ncbi:MAG: glycosyltransferase [Solirubrobacterales bacterium]|nr:glycosyltransferase [Solirubrobacterales bacterium]
MRIGICAYWFNRGQGVVARQLRSGLDSLGHETFVLARPTRAGNIRPAFVDRSGVWDQPRITEASRYEIPPDELVAWGRESGLDVAFFDQNYGFEAIGALRGAGVRTVGRFVWEQFSTGDVEPARRALDVVYSLTACERERYAEMGIESPRVRWGIHPELFAYARDRQARPAAGGGLRFFYPAGFLSRRKPVKEVLRAFRRVDGDASLVVKGQVERELGLLERAVARDPRVEVVLEDLPIAEHMALFASADVCLAPSRWEGLGLHLYESMALGMPVITNDNPPMNEVIRDGENGLLVRARRRGRATSGIPAYAPGVRGLAAAIDRCREPGVLDRLRAGVERARAELSWDRTVADYAALLAQLG